MSEQANGATRLKPPFMAFIRHGQTDWNAEGRMQGQQDIPINDIGRSQAQRNGEALRAYLEASGRDHSELEFFASPLSRTVETMRIVCRALERDEDAFGRDDRLREITFGAWEGFTIPELAEKTPELTAARKADKWGFVPPEGESYRMLMTRVEAWLVTLDRPSVVVSHGGVMRVLRGCLLGVPKPEIPTLDTPQDKVLIWDGADLSFI